MFFSTFIKNIKNVFYIYDLKTNEEAVGRLIIYGDTCCMESYLVTTDDATVASTVSRVHVTVIVTSSS